MTDVDDVVAANAELYAAIEAGDADRIAAMWDDADDVVCVHPGWPVVVGRSRVLRSWAVILANTAYIQFFATGSDIAVNGDVALVSCEYGVLARSDEGDTGFGESARVVASNVFRRRDGGWRLWSHHASPILSGGEPGEEIGER
ncbi:MAG TPA: nuclear transport factor 2 family protein [Mycobacteriales bacterium]|jgi:ketosteroid isomerase-like protein|nr:nuclear transport factor 2 family protein [Mycobacteriales bacterium]